MTNQDTKAMSILVQNEKWSCYVAVALFIISIICILCAIWVDKTWKPFLMTGALCFLLSKTFISVSKCFKKKIERMDNDKPEGED